MDSLLEVFKSGKKVSFSPELVNNLVVDILNEKDKMKQVLFSTYIAFAINDGIITPENLLLYSILNCEDNSALYLIGLSLRFGANPNTYVNVISQGNIHILAYAAMVFKESARIIRLFNSVQLILLLSGSNPFLPVYSMDEKHTSVDIEYIHSIQRTITDQFEFLPPYMRTEMSQFNVITWIQGLQYNVIEFPKKYLESLGEPTISIFGVILDNPDYFQVDSFNQKKDVDDILFSRNTPPMRFEFIIKCMSFRIINLLTYDNMPQINTMVAGESFSIKTAIEGVNYKTFDLMMKKGAHVTYFSMNRLCVYYKRAVEDKLRPIYKVIGEMILRAVDMGIQLDLYQLAILRFVDSNFATEVLKHYSKPEWEKVCKIVNYSGNKEGKKAGDRLRELAFELNLNYNMNEEDICKKIEKIASIDIQEYYKAVLKRQEERVGTQLTTATDFVGRKDVPSLKCNNTTLLGVNPYAYNDARLAFYKDNDSKVWCFTSDLFPSLIENKINPFNREKLPSSFLHTIICQKNILDELEVGSKETILDALKSLKKPDSPNNKKDELIYDTFIKACHLFGIEETNIRSLDYTTINLLLDEILMQQDYLNELEKEHQLITFARAVYSKTKRNRTMAPTFYESIAKIIGLY